MTCNESPCGLSAEGRGWAGSTGGGGVCVCARVEEEGRRGEEKCVGVGVWAWCVVCGGGREG